MPRQVTNDDLTELVDLVKKSEYPEDRKRWLILLRETVETYLLQTENEALKMPDMPRHRWVKPANWGKTKWSINAYGYDPWEGGGKNYE